MDNTCSSDRFKRNDFLVTRFRLKAQGTEFRNPGSGTEEPNYTFY